MLNFKDLTNMFTNVIFCKDTNLFGIDAELTKNNNKPARAGDLNN